MSTLARAERVDEFTCRCVELAGCRRRARRRTARSRSRTHLERAPRRSAGRDPDRGTVGTRRARCRAASDGNPASRSWTRASIRSATPCSLRSGVASARSRRATRRWRQHVHPALGEPDRLSAGSAGDVERPSRRRQVAEHSLVEQRQRLGCRRCGSGPSSACCITLVPSGAILIHPRILADPVARTDRISGRKACLRAAGHGIIGG